MGSIYWLSDDATDSKVYPYNLPEFDAELLINSKDLPLDKQHWVKQEIPKGKTEYETLKWKKTEVKRVAKGCWFYNNGELVYINGYHYLFLQYTRSFEAQFSHSQKEYCYFLELVDNDPKCLGQTTMKPRRAGISYIEHARIIHKSLFSKNNLFGLLSTDFIKVKKVLMTPIIDLYNGLPSYLKPEGYTQNTKVKYSSKENIESEVSTLNNDISAQSTTVTAYDGLKMYHICVDEIWKIVNLVDVEKLISVHKKCLIDKFVGKIVGKMSLISTLGVDKDKMSKAIKTGIDVWHTSDYTNKDDNGMTKSGFYRYFISALDAQNIDKYGVADKEKNRKDIQKDLTEAIEQKGFGSDEHITCLRQDPTTINDLLESINATSTFGKRPQVKLKSVKDKPISERGYIKGVFYETPSGQISIDTDIKEDGMYWKLKYRDIPNSNLCVYRYGEWHPPRNPDTIVGLDNIRVDENLSKNVSHAGMHILKMCNNNGNYTDDDVELIGQFYYRTDVETIEKQFLFATRYFGAVCSYERQVESTVRFMKRENADNLLIQSPYDRLKGILMSKRFMTDGINFLIDAFKNPKEGEQDFLETICFEETLEQLVSFTPDKLKKHDLIASLFQVCVGSRRIQKSIIRSNSGLKQMYQQLY